MQPFRHFLFFLTIALTGAVYAQTDTTNQSTTSAPRAFALLDVSGDGRADVVLCDCDQDGLTDRITLSSAAPAQAVPTGAAARRVQGVRAGLSVADIDGDGRPELLTTASQRQGAQQLLNDQSVILEQIRQALASGLSDSIDSLVASGWLTSAATTGNPLAHVSGGPGGGVSSVPMPSPDPENNPTGSSSGGGIGGTGIPAGGGIPLSVGNDAGVDRGVYSGHVTGTPPG